MKRLFLGFVCLVVFVSCSGPETKEAQYSSGKYSMSLQQGKVVASEPWVVNIEKQEDEDFVILSLTDIQFGTCAYFSYWSGVSKMIDSLVEQSDPDLIMITGDISYGCWPAFLGICSYINNYGIPWVVALGNHDCEDSGISLDMQAKALNQFDNCVFKYGPENLAIDAKYGNELKGNYVVNIVSQKEDSFSIVRSFVIINSGSCGVSEFQRQWYVDCASAVPESKVAVVMHIPTDGFYDAAHAAFKNYWGKDRITLEESYTSKGWNEGYESSFGVQHEGIASFDSVPFRTYAENTGNTDFFLCGHDHCNCTCIKYNGITYVFSLKTGPGCYYEEGLQGGTMLTMSKDGEIKTEHLFY